MDIGSNFLETCIHSSIYLLLVPAFYTEIILTPKVPAVRNPHLFIKPLFAQLLE